MKKIVISLSTVVAAGIIVFLLIITAPIKIGVLISLDSSIGNEELLSLQHYVRTHQQIGLRPVQLLVENPELNEKSITASFNKLLAQDVSLIIGASLSYSGQIAAKLAKNKNIAFISPTTSTSSLLNKKDNFYRIIMSNYEQGIHPARHVSKQGLKSAVLLLSEQNKAYSEPLADAFIEGFTGKAIKFFNDPENPIPEQIIAMNPEIVFFILPASETIHYLKPLKKQLPDTMIMTSTWGAQQLKSVFSGEILEGLLVVTPSGPERNEPFKSILNDFSKQYRMEPSFVSDMTIVAIKLAYTAIEKAGTTRGDIIKELDTPRIMEWSFGPLYMNEYGDVIQDYYYMYVLKDDTFQLVQKFKIEEFFNATDR